MSNFTKPPNSHYMTYRIARGEQGVLTYEPYKSYLLPYWRFRSIPIARESSRTLWTKFLEFYEQDDFVGMDMARKFIQMGMTRSKRYANYKGGRKYVDGKEKGNVLEKSKGHAGKEEKEGASLIFREVWERCREHEGYAELKRVFLNEQKEWLEMEKTSMKKEEDMEEDGVIDTKPNTRSTRRSTKMDREDDVKVEKEHFPIIKTEND